MHDCEIVALDVKNVLMILNTPHVSVHQLWQLHLLGEINLLLHIKYDFMSTFLLIIEEYEKYIDTGEA